MMEYDDLTITVRIYTNPTDFQSVIPRSSKRFGDNFQIVLIERHELNVVPSL